MIQKHRDAETKQESSSHGHHPRQALLPEPLHFRERTSSTYARGGLLGGQNGRRVRVRAGELAAAVVESSDEVQRLAFRASKAEQAILSGVGYDLRVAHPHGPARALIDGVDVDVSRIEDECDKLLTTDAPLLYAPSLLAAVACLKVGGCEEN